MPVSRRTLLLGGPSMIGLGSLPLFAQEAEAIHVVKDPGCPCCNGWIGYLRESGFAVSFEVRSAEDLAAFKAERGIPEELVSCHTATIGAYTIEGHVPAEDIRKLLAQKPDAIGLSVPGMPIGSPGMGPEAAREAYEVILVAKDGSGSVFTSYAAA